MTKVTLRKRRIGKGKTALYTDTYPAINGRMKSLHLYISTNPKGPVERRRNREVLEQAEHLVARQQNELNKPEIYSRQELQTLSELQHGEDSFFSFCKKRISKAASISTATVYKVAVQYFLQYSETPELTFKDITSLYLQEFRQFMLTAKKFKSDRVISRTSASVYFSAIKSLISDAYAGGFLKKDIGAEVEKIKPTEKHREGFSIEELILLKEANCSDSLIKNAGLFSALTGLRFIDIVQLERRHINRNENGWYLDFIQEKTDGANVLPISDQAYDLIPENLFKELDYQKMQRSLKKWLSVLGRPCTFHYFRHTYALLLLKSGVDILTVSSMMGHKSIQSTQVYAKALETNKVNAANLIRI